MEPDISTLHKPDILILRRHTPFASLTNQYPGLKIDSASFFRACAQVAELADALASGASGRKVVEVRVLSWAPFLPCRIRTHNMHLPCAHSAKLIPQPYRCIAARTQSSGSTRARRLHGISPPLLWPPCTKSRPGSSPSQC